MFRVELRTFCPPIEKNSRQKVADFPCSLTCVVTYTFSFLLFLFFSSFFFAEVLSLAEMRDNLHSALLAGYQVFLFFIFYFLNEDMMRYDLLLLLLLLSVHTHTRTQTQTDTHTRTYTHTHTHTYTGHSSGDGALSPRISHTS